MTYFIDLYLLNLKISGSTFLYTYPGDKKYFYSMNHANFPVLTYH